MPPTFAYWFARISAAILAANLGVSAHAQGGPPLVTDDPDTPGNGNWEINAAIIAAKHQQHWDLAAPDLDINYGWGEHVQLKVDLNWATADSVTGRRMSGFGATDIGVKWRFVDQDKSGFALSVYPQVLTNFSPSSAVRGLTTENREFFLPVEMATEFGEFKFGAEVGRNFIQRGSDSWVGGLIVAHPCGPNLACGVELHGVLTERQLEPLVNFGVHWQIVKHVILLAAAGREFSSGADNSQGLLFYFGFQLLRES